MIPSDLKLGQIAIRILQSQAADTAEEGVAFLAEALTMAEPEGLIRIFVDEGLVLAPLLRQAISRGIKPEYSRKLLKSIEEEERQRQIRKGEIPASPSNAGLMSERELEVMYLIAQGLTNQQIADKLFISLHTVKVHVRHILDKLDANRRSQAITRARELELL